MDLSGAAVYHAVCSGPPDQKHAVLQELKLHVKKGNVQLSWVGKYFEAFSIATDSPDSSLRTLAFSLVCHLVKRVSIQDVQGSVLSEQGVLVLPILIPRIADRRSSIKVSAKRALEAYWLSAPKTVEGGVAEFGLANRNPLVVNECVAWLNYILTGVSPHFQLESFLDPLARILRDHAGDEKLATNVRVLLENYYDMQHNRIRKFELQKALERNCVPAALRTSIMGTASLMFSEQEGAAKGLPGINSGVSSRVSALVNPVNPVINPVNSSSSPPPYTEKPAHIPNANPNSTGESPGLSPNPELRAYLAKLPNYAYDASISPLDVAESGEIWHMVSEMASFFDSKETERNWSSREKSILKLRGLIRGNALSDFLPDLISCIKELHEGICKSLSSLRTTLSVNSCQLVKEMAFLLRHNFDALADLFVPTLVKLCSNTKSMTNTNANVAMCAIMAQSPLTTKMAQKILNAAWEKSVNTKAFACSWLQIFVIRSHDQWRGSGSDIAQKVLLKLLPDPNMQVRSAAKDAFWKYYEYAETSALELRSQLDSNIDKALERSRPKRLATPAAPTLVAQKVRPSLKESILARKKELKSKQGESRSASRHDLIHPAPHSEKSATPSLPQYSRNASVERHVRSHTSNTSLPSLPGNDSRHSFDRLLDTDSPKVNKSANSSPEARSRKFVRSHVSPNSTSEPHYAQPTFSHPSPSSNHSQRHSEFNAEHRRIVSYPDQHVNHAHKSPVPNSVPNSVPSVVPNNTPSNVTNSVPSRTQPEARTGADSTNASQAAEDPMVRFLLSSKDELLKEGINLLKQALMSGEEIEPRLTATLKKLSVTNPMFLKPVFEVDVLPKAFKLFTPEDFLRLVCILTPPTQETFDVVVSLFTADAIYLSVGAMLSHLLELTDIVDDGSLIMQLIKFKERILSTVLRILIHATSKVPITDVTFARLSSNLFELVPVVHQTKLMDEYKASLCTLYDIDSKLFVSQLSSVSPVNKLEIELTVGIEGQSDFKNTEPTMFNMTEFTRISPGKSNLEHLSPLKFPSDFTMLLPTNKVKAEPKASLEESNVDVNDASLDNKTAMSIDEQRICLDDPPQMEVVSEEDIMMEEPEDNHNVSMKSSVEGERMDVSHREKPHEAKLQDDPFAGIKLEAVDFNVLKKSETDSPKNGTIVKDGPHELVEDFASVRLTSQSNSIETFIEKVDPLSKLSSRNRPISIFDDSTAGSPQKVKDYDFAELNWFNFLMTKMTLDYGPDVLERYSKDDFRSLCEQLTKGTANKTSIATMMRYLRAPDPESLSAFLRNEGFRLVEEAVMAYMNFDHSNLLAGLMIIKQLLVNRHAPDISRLWQMLVDLSGLESDEPLRTLDLAVSDTFDEVLCGLYATKDLLAMVTRALEENKSMNEGALRFALESLFKLMSTETLVLSINAELVFCVDRAIRPYISDKRAVIRKIVIETYGRAYRAARISGVSGGPDSVLPSGKSSHDAMTEILSCLTMPQRRIIEYFSQER